MFVFCLFGSLTEPLPCKPNAKFSFFFVLCSGVLLLPFLLTHSHTSTALTLAFCPLCLSPLRSHTHSLPLTLTLSHSACTPWVAPCLGPLGCFIWFFLRLRPVVLGPGVWIVSCRLSLLRQPLELWLRGLGVLPLLSR